MTFARLTPYWPVALVALLAFVPAITSANTVLNFLIFALIIALSAQGWNILAGYGGQFSFGHAAFFGMGAYGTALYQVRLGLDPWSGFACGVVLAGLTGAAIGYLSFRSGLRGSYFALVTLAFAEVFRILFNAATFTGGAGGLLVKLDVRPENFQFANRTSFYSIALALVAAVVALTIAIERSRFGMWLIAIRENEDAAKALGVDVLWVKLQAITLSAAITGSAGCLYVQYFLYLDANIGFGSWISVETLMAPIIGGTGTALGPVVGALALQVLGQLTKGIAGSIPGIDLMLFAALLIVCVAFMRDGIVGKVCQLVVRCGGLR